MPFIKPIDKEILEISKDGGGEIKEEAALSYLKRKNSYKNASSAASSWKNMKRRLSALEKRKIVTRAGEDRWNVPSDLEVRIRERSVLYPKVTVTERVREKFKQRER